MHEITPEIIQDALQKRILLYDKTGEEHYNLISALHKSVRNSDPDASLYWLGRMLEAGEDPLYIARRVVRMAVEDIGLAEPNALALSMAARDAVDFIGMPEGNLALAQAVVYLSWHRNRMLCTPPTDLSKPTSRELRPSPSRCIFAMLRLA
jgi:putative ATPase